MKKFLRGKKTYLSILAIIMSIAISHYSPIKVSADELRELADRGTDVVEITRRDLWPTLMGLFSSLAAIWARRRTDIELEEDLEEAGIPPRVLNPKTGQPFKGGLFLVALGCFLFLPSCQSNLLEDGGNPQVSAFAGDATAVGAEIAFGVHRVGLAVTYRNLPDPNAPPIVEREAPYVYPIHDK